MRTTRTRIAAIAAATALTATLITTTVATSTTTLALPGASESTFVAVTPTRVLDTRLDVGLTGNFTAANSRKLDIAGTIETYDEAADTRTDKIVVPTGATGVTLNVTAFQPTAGGVVSVRPGNATGAPSTSNLNVLAGQIIPNAVTVNIPTTGTGAGQIDITYFGAAPGNTIDIIIDIVGYTSNTGLQDLTNRLIALETTGTGGPQGDKGDTGAQGLPGTNGTNGIDATTPNGVAWVAASGGDYTKVSDALTAGEKWIMVAPGTYTETAPLLVTYDVSITGAGPDRTTIRCACGGSDAVSAFLNTSDSSTIYASTFDNLTLRDLTVTNTGGAGTAWAIGVKSYQSEARFTNVVITSSGSTNNVGLADVRIADGIYNDITVTASGGSTATAFYAQTVADSILNNARLIGLNGTVTTSAIDSDSTVITQSYLQASSGFGTVDAIQAGTFSVKIADSTIIGGSGAAGNVTCIGARDGNFVALNTSCA